MRSAVNPTSEFDGVEVGPSSGNATSAVIWLHGLGASGHDFEPIVPMLDMPNTRFVFPHAPKRPVTINMGMVMPAWYDILSFDRSGVRESEEDIRDAMRLVENLLERERERGIPSERTVLAGFSQGGAVALCTANRHAHVLGGVMVLSAYEVLGDSLEAERSEASKTPPALFCHGRLDEVVPVWLGKAAYERTAALDPDRVIDWHDYAMGHEVCPEEIGQIRQWLHGVVGRG